MWAAPVSTRSQVSSPVAAHPSPQAAHMPPARRFGIAPRSHRDGGRCVSHWVRRSAYLAPPARRDEEHAWRTAWKRRLCVPVGLAAMGCCSLGAADEATAVATRRYERISRNPMIGFQLSHPSGLATAF